MAAGGAIAVVVVAIGALVGVKLASGPARTSEPVGSPAPPSAYTVLKDVPLSTLANAAANYSIGQYPVAVNGKTLTSGGKPEVLYIGAEYCPFCAAERWPLIVALSKFGTFSGLKLMLSSPTDVYPSTPTFSFYGSSYSSPYLAFTPVETETRSYKPLQAPTKAEQKLLATYDVPPYVSAQSSDGIPFLYFGKAIIAGASYNPSVLAGKTQTQVVRTIERNPASPITDNIEAAAGVITSYLCQMTAGEPGSVCSAFPHPVKG